MKSWNIEMKSRDEFRPKEPAPRGFEVHKVDPCCPDLNRLMHHLVGTPWKWGGREGWGCDQWAEYTANPAMETWIAYLDNITAGYAELVTQEDGSQRIMTFGLRQEFIGRGIGGCFLSDMIRRCWDRGANRVWLNTCSNDHPHALKNYQARGFTIFEEKIKPDNR